jgi:SAM-dependent methyltransferase
MKCPDGCNKNRADYPFFKTCGNRNKADGFILTDRKYTHCFFMQTTVLDSKKDPLGAMLLDYWNGNKEAVVIIHSPLLEMSQMSGRLMFRSPDQMSPIELKALALCQGRILDVGAGSGCHSLYLQEHNKEVVALDISPGCIEVMEKRKVAQRSCNSLFALENQRYDTLLMLMNGLGICGSLDGLNLFFQCIKPLLSAGGQVLADSTDLASFYSNNEIIPGNEGYYGETEFTMGYKDITGDPFEWLYIDAATLAYYAAFHGWQCDVIMAEADGKYLARIH